MPEKEIHNVDSHVSAFIQALPFVLVIGLSCMGGIVSYLNRIDRSGIAFSFIRLVVEVVTSGFVGIIAFMLCDYAGLEWSVTAAIVAISGHMGTRALFIIENIAIKMANNLTEGNNYGNRERETKSTKEADQ